jgi:pyruvate dehydrogenase E2 component (dihydrolipoamide acetyltransferase)
MDGTLLNWLKNLGDSVNKGEVVAEIEADKATVEVEAPESGVLVSLSANPGDSLTDGAVIGMIGAAGEAVPTVPVAASSPQGEGARASQPVVKASETGAPAGTAARTNGAPASVTEDGRIKASPLARKLAEERGINLVQVRGTGPGGRITREDVEGFGTPPPSPVPAATVQPSGFQPVAARKLPEGPDVEYIELNNMRKRIVAVTVESKQQIPHFYVTTEIDVENLLNLRKQLNEGLSDEQKISVNDMVVKAAALTLKQFPNLNSHYYGDRVVRHKRINIGMAVALPNGGLINVVAHDADKVALGSMAQQNKEMFARAREGKVKPEDISGATFTVSNLGPYNVEHFLAVINPPEAGILAVGTAVKVPVVKADGTLGVGNRMKVTISVDHRVSDGAEGAQYLQALKTLIENPMRLLI